jgi:cardiolipin synthase A/B
MKKIAVPMLTDSISLSIKEGKPYCIIDHGLLWALFNETLSARELASISDLPIQIVIESVVRLIKAGWAQFILCGETAARFEITLLGKSVVTNKELPYSYDVRRTWIGYSIDLLTGHVFSSNDLNLYFENQLKQDILKIKANFTNETFPTSYIISKLLRPDQRLASLDVHSQNPKIKYAIFKINESQVEDLPAGSPEELSNILAAYANSDEHVIPSSNNYVMETHRYRETTKIDLNQSDVIIGGDRHCDHLKKLGARANRLLIILSTFLNDKFSPHLRESIVSAAKNGAEVIVLLGKDEDAEAGESNTSRLKNVEAFGNQPEFSPYKNQIQIVHYSMKTHAKILIADDGEGNFSTTIGSYNWLSSGDSGLDVSANLKSNRLSALILEVIEKMISRPGRIQPEICRTLIELSQELLSRAPSLPTGNAEVRLVCGREHNDMMLKARDSARTRIYCQSHRFSQTARPTVFSPLRAAASQGVKADLVFESLNCPHAFYTDSKQELAPLGINLYRLRKKGHDNRSHAKLLIWDDDEAVITSQNWMNRDPSDSDLFSEIGVYIRRENIRDFILGSALSELEYQ